MHRHILIPTDGSELSAKTIEYGIALAKAVGARVTGLTVLPPWPGGSELAADLALSSRESARAAAASRLAQISRAAAEAGAPVANMISAYGGIRWGTGVNRALQYRVVAAVNDDNRTAAEMRLAAAA